MPTVVATSTSSTATAYSNQRKIDRTSNGVLWSFFPNAGSNQTIAFAYYSTDNGATWTDSTNYVLNGSSGTGTTYVKNFSVFIDQDDYCHVVFKDNSDGFIYYRRGAPNAGRTSYTWSAATLISNVDTSHDYPDIVAHREGTGWAAHIVLSRNASASVDRVMGYRIDITSGGSLSVMSYGVLGGAYGNTVHKYPSIDFNHTGDGKTVAGGTPHLYVAWSAGDVGAGKGIRFKKATYSAGTWTWGTEREIDSARYIATPDRWLNCLFDGTRVIMPGFLNDGGGTADLVLHERDAADTTTTTRLLVNDSASNQHFFQGSATYDSAGNVWFVGRDYDGTTQHIDYAKWERSTATLGAHVLVDNTNISNATYVASVKRGYSNNRIEFIYTDGTASPYEVKYSFVGDTETLNKISTSTVVAATAFANQRKIDRCQNGVLWAIWDVGSVARFDLAYSTDNGATWTTTTGPAHSSTGRTYQGSASFFIDIDDYAHLVYKDISNGQLYYVRGTPNAGRTAWTWSGTSSINATASGDYADIIAHREGTGWKAHILHSQGVDGSNSVLYGRVNITSGGTITVDSISSPDIASVYGSASHRYPSLDFNHTGDGKTVAGGTPHLYAAWSAGTTGVGKGIRFKKATYSAGAWTWGTEREIDNARYVQNPDNWINCLFDGTAVVLVCQVTSATNDTVIYERNAADTATTTLLSATTSGQFYEGSSTYDDFRNIFLFGSNAGQGYYAKWSRGVGLGSKIVFDGNINSTPYFSARRGYAGSRIDAIYTARTASPYDINHFSLVSNNPPTITITTPTENQKLDPRVVQTVSWTYSDPESKPQASWTASVKTSSPAPTTYSGGAAAQTGSILTFTVPTTGTYKIEAIGANGGQSSDSNAGGKGAKVVGDFSLTAGQVLNIIAGKPGAKPSTASRGGSGGGASWVYKTGDSQPLIVAGGGGGAGNYAYDATVQDASTSTAGKNGTVSGGAGGTAGSGGAAGSYASGGAGWSGNGSSTSYTSGGLTPTNGATGGNGYSPNTEGANGGFGGGGGSYAGAGGGGGYSGGGAGGWANAGHGGGGGSYNAGTNQVNTAGVGTGEGSVTITLNQTTVFSTSGTTATTFNIPANSMADEKNYEINLSVSDGTASTAVKRNIVSDSWNYETEVVSSTQSGNFNASSFVRGDTYQIAVATADAEGFSPWSSAVTYLNDNIPEARSTGEKFAFNADGIVKWIYIDKDADQQSAYQIRIRKKI